MNGPKKRILSLGIGWLCIAGCTHQSQKATHDSYFGPVKEEIYVVRKGDTLYAIARRLNQDFSTLAANNHLTSPWLIRPGQKLVISPSSHFLTAGHSQKEEDAFFRLIERKSQAVTVRQVPTNSSQKVGKKSSEVDQYYQRYRDSGKSGNKNEKKAGNRVTNDVKQLTNAENVVDHRDSDWAYPVNGKVIRKFSAGGKLSKGIDFAAKAGTPVTSARAGKVVYSGSQLKGYGNLIIIKHDDVYLSAYAHNRKILVREGELIRKGQKIAELGSTGTTQPKLHFQIRRLGKPIDPLKLLRK